MATGFLFTDVAAKTIFQKGVQRDCSANYPAPPPEAAGAPQIRALNDGSIQAFRSDSWQQAPELAPYVDQLRAAYDAAAPVVPPAPVPTLAQKQATAQAVVDSKAEAVRYRYITPGAGQAGTYVEKEKQADAFKAAGYTGTVPSFVQAEVDATGQTAQQAADAIIAQRDQWLVKGAAIERERRKGKIAIGNATTLAGVDSAMNAALAALDAL